MEPPAPEGHVLVEGEIWDAVASESVPPVHACASWGTNNICCEWRRLSRPQIAPNRCLESTREYNPC